MKIVMMLILAATIPTLWLAMQIDDSSLGLPVLTGILLAAATYCWIARRSDGSIFTFEQKRDHDGGKDLETVMNQQRVRRLA